MLENVLLLVQTGSWLDSQYIKYAGRNLAQNGKCENPAAPQVGRKLNNGRKCHPEKGGGRKRAEMHKLCRRIYGGQDKSQLLPQQSRILQERILGHANAQL